VPGLDFDVPTTADDVAALRAARARSLAVRDWRHLEALEPLLPAARRRRTAAGWEPFTLDDPQ
jgi:hypothetical protein